MAHIDIVIAAFGVTLKLRHLLKSVSCHDVFRVKTTVLTDRMPTHVKHATQSYDSGRSALKLKTAET